MRPKPFERATSGLVSEVIHSVEQPALAKRRLEFKLYSSSVKLPHLFCPVFGSEW